MKKILLGAMMSALFVMNAEAGIFKSIKNKVVQVQHKIKNDRAMDEKKEIQPFKTYLNNVITTMGKLYEIMDVGEKVSFGPAQDAMKQFIMNVARKSYVKGTAYDEKIVRSYINKIANDDVWSALRDHTGTQEYKNFVTAVGNAHDFTLRLQQRYSDNAVLNRTVAGLASIAYVVSGDKAADEEAARQAAAAARQKEAELQAEQDYQFRIAEAARLEEEAEAKRQAEEAARIQAEADEAARIRAEQNLAKFNEDYPLSSDVDVTQSMSDLSSLTSSEADSGQPVQQPQSTQSQLTRSQSVTSFSKRSSRRR